MTWKLESARHALASKGIKTKVNARRGIAGREMAYQWTTGFNFKNKEQAEDIIVTANNMPDISAYLYFSRQDYPIQIIVNGKTKEKLQKAIELLEKKGYKR